MTGTADKLTLTVVDLVEASRKPRQHKLTVDEDLEAYIEAVLIKLVENPSNRAHVYATLHTLLTIGIDAGIEAERRRLHDIIDAAPMV